MFVYYLTKAYSQYVHNKVKPFFCVPMWPQETQGGAPVKCIHSLKQLFEVKHAFSNLFVILQEIRPYLLMGFSETDFKTQKQNGSWPWVQGSATMDALSLRVWRPVATSRELLHDSHVISSGEKATFYLFILFVLIVVYFIWYVVNLVSFSIVF